MHFGRSKLETTPIYASALSERRRETVMALEFAAPKHTAAKPHAARRARRSA